MIDLEILGNVVGADLRQYFTYLHGLLELLALPGTYCEEWVREFYASVWVSPHHSYIHYALAGTDYRVTAQSAREVLGLRAYSTGIHQLCYGNIEPPRRPHGGELPPVDFKAPCFRQPFGEGSSRTGVGVSCHTHTGSPCSSFVLGRTSSSSPAERVVRLRHRVPPLRPPTDAESTPRPQSSTTSSCTTWLLTVLKYQI